MFEASLGYMRSYLQKKKKEKKRKEKENHMEENMFLLENSGQRRTLVRR